ncbi:MAG: Abi-alpha family protein [Methanosarcina sp.]
MSELEEIAKAVTSTAEFSTASVGSIEKMGGFFAKVLNEPLTEAVGIIGDKLNFMRWKRKLRMVDEVNRILDQRGITDTRAIPPKLAIPILEQACLEENDELQDIWCRLIANSLDPKFNLEIRYAFIEIIKNMTALDAKILKYIYETTIKINKINQTKPFIAYSVDFFHIKENVRASNVETELSLNNLQRVQCIRDNDVNDLRTQVNSMIKKTTPPIIQHSSFKITPLGTAFILACMK